MNLGPFIISQYECAFSIILLKKDWQCYCNDFIHFQYNVHRQRIQISEQNVVLTRIGGEITIIMLRCQVLKDSSKNRSYEVEAIIINCIDKCSRFCYF